MMRCEPQDGRGLGRAASEASGSEVAPAKPALEGHEFERTGEFSESPTLS